MPRFKLLTLFLLLGFLTACTSLFGLAPVDKPTPGSPALPQVAAKTPLALPTPTSTAKPQCVSQAGTLESGQIESDKIDKPMRYLVYLPPCYSQDPAIRYPVIYLLHGQNFTEEQWIRIGAKDSADELINSGRAAPFIMVFPYDYSYKQPTEYAFEDVFLHQLMPRVDGGYRTKTDRANRAIGGVSRGGAWALHMGLRNFDLFGAIGGHSPAIFFADHKNLPESLQAIPSDKLPRIWLDISVSDKELDLIKQFEQLLTNNHLPHEWAVNPGYHEEKYWAEHVDEYLAWYTRVWMAE